MLAKPGSTVSVCPPGILGFPGAWIEPRWADGSRQRAFAPYLGVGPGGDGRAGRSGAQAAAGPSRLDAAMIVAVGVR
jgi:hypothetical protein